MNIRGGLALVRKSLFSFTASAGFFWTLAFGWMMGPLIFLFVWTRAVEVGPTGGFARGDFALYYLVLILVNQLTYPCSHWTIGDSIYSGALSVWLLRPLPLIYEAVAGDVALKIVSFPFALVVVIVLALFIRPAAVDAGRIPIFLLLLLGAQMLRFMFAYVASLVALWTQKIRALLAINDTLVFLFAGQMVPVPLLPGILRDAAVLLPFRYMLGFPIEYLLGKMTNSELRFGLLVMLSWLGIAFLAHQLIYTQGIKKYTAVGG